MMAELPARVWLDGSMKPWPAYANKANSGEVEYIRADIADQMAEALDALRFAPEGELNEHELTRKVEAEGLAMKALAAYREAKG